MKKILAATAVAMVIAAPAFAQSYDPDLGSGNISAQVAPSGAYRGGAGAFARVVPGQAGFVRGTRLQSPNAVYDGHGQLIGADPDANVRMQLQKDNDIR
jgi:hypothetical protein